MLIWLLWFILIYLTIKCIKNRIEEINDEEYKECRRRQFEREAAEVERQYYLNKTKQELKEEGLLKRKHEIEELLDVESLWLLPKVTLLKRYLDYSTEEAEEQLKLKEKEDAIEKWIERTKIWFDVS